ncbi:MAG: DUF2510 domain-containing protein [Thermoleophilaceae bacterium]|nr:DUF2510 domain-containing protein [Thermoleophilaceae bacterium]
MDAQGPQPQQQPPGWYPNPQGPGKRYWDGTQWTGSYQAQKEDHTTRNVLIVVGVFVGVLLLFVGGCVACAGVLGSAGNEAVKEIDKELEREQKRNAITTAEYRSLEIGGVTKQEVTRRFGRPESSDELGPREGGSDCIKYKQEDGDFLDTFQLCFDPRTGKLQSKSKP